MDDLARLAEVKRGPGDPECYRHDFEYLSIEWKTEDYLRAKLSARQALQEPYPTCYSLEQFFGVGFPTKRSCGGCRGSEDAKHIAVVRSVTAALEAYPQTITKRVKRLAFSSTMPFVYSLGLVELQQISKTRHLVLMHSIWFLNLDMRRNWQSDPVTSATSRHIVHDMIE